MRAILCLALVAAAGCYQSNVADGQYTCNPTSSPSCPGGFHCNDCGQCVMASEPTTCTGGGDASATVDGGSAVDAASDLAVRPDLALPPLPGCSNGTGRVQGDPRLDSVAFCAGAWLRGGNTTDTPCNRRPGPDGTHDGNDCTMEDNCAENWHVCMDDQDAQNSGLTVCPNVNGFYATFETGGTAGTSCGGGTTIAGCGNFSGLSTNDCMVLVKSFTLGTCAAGASPWNCNTSTNTITDLTKPMIHNGGVICCKNP